MGYPSAYLSVPDERGFCFTQAFQSVGLGLATAIGAALARPDRLPVAALGDGGALMAAAELETVVRLGLPMVVVVYDDAATAPRCTTSRTADHATVTFPETDLAAVGRGLRVRGGDGPGAGRPEGRRRLGGRAARRRRCSYAPIASDGGSWWLARRSGATDARCPIGDGKSGRRRTPALPSRHRSGRGGAAAPSEEAGS